MLVVMPGDWSSIDLDQSTEQVHLPRTASLLLTRRRAKSRGPGAIVKPSPRHICSIGSFSRMTSPKSPGIAQRPAAG
jgi:hypothetical protein